MGRNKMYGAAILAAAVMGVMGGSAMATPWTFGVMSDTQLTGVSGNDALNAGTNGVPLHVIDEVHKQFNLLGVSAVVQVGDLTESGGNSQLQTHLDAVAGAAQWTDSSSVTHTVTKLDAPFYGLRGNHEDNGKTGSTYNTTSANQTFFQNNYLPGGSNVEIGPDNISYAITINNTKLVLLDIQTAYTTAMMDSATTWMTTVLGESDHTQAFVFQHKNLVGQNHKDNQFQTGSAQDANPTQQNNFISTLETNNVKWNFSGHDHMNHRAIITAPNGVNKVQEIICASDSTKFYAQNSGFLSRDVSISDQQGTVGLYTVTVDGPRVTGKYYAADINLIGSWSPTSGGNGDIVANPVWKLQDTFGYSTNGKQFTVARGGSYTGVNDQIAAGAGFQGTSMHILSGVNATTATAEGGRACADDLNTGWSPLAQGKSGAVSDVLSIWGMNNALGSDQTDPFAIAVSFDPALITGGATTSDIAIYSKDASGNWVNTVSLNYGGTSQFVLGAYDSGYGLGTYGVDTTTHEAWAVINHNSDFVAAVPEPASLAFMGVSALMLGRRRRKA